MSPIGERFRERIPGLWPRRDQNASRRREEQHPGVTQRGPEPSEPSRRASARGSNAPPVPQLVPQLAGPSAAERRSEQGPERDARRGGEDNERRGSTNPSSNSYAPSRRSGSPARSSDRSENPPPSEPPSYHSETPSYHTNASGVTDLPEYSLRPPGEERVETREERLERERDIRVQREQHDRSQRYQRGGLGG